ncbi:hypothetical protein [Streptomyces sp. NBC_00443]|uniref:hypothetical protein n=1 Tax=Streptomyces sp. NBC_00443 TaxID=2975743 RepID=UPI002E1F1D54
MAVSLGMRISGLLVVGAVAVAAAAFTSDGGGTADGRGGEGTIVTAGPSERGGGPTEPADRSAPVAQQSPNGRAGENASGPTAVPSGLPGGTVSASPSPPPPLPSPSGKGTVVLQAPPWLPPGPTSPDSDGAPDPASVYDLLRAPERCASALGKIPQGSAEAEWQLLRGLSAACLAVQGRGGDWDAAAGAHAELAGRVDSCKGRAAYAVLGGLLDFHRRHPGGTVRLAAAPGGTPACGYRIAGVDTGGDGEARPGDTIGIELTGIYFDQAELLRDASVSVGGLVVPGVPVLKSESESGGRLVLSVAVPALEPGPAEVAVRHAGTEVRLPAAFTVTGPDTVEEPGTGTGVSDEPGSPAGAAASDLGGRLSSLGTEAPDPSGPGSPPGTELPNPGRRLAPPGTEAPDLGGPGASPGTELPDLGGRLSPLGTELPDLGGRLSPLGTELPDLGGPGSPPGTELPNPNRRLAPPGTEAPDLGGPGASPGTELPDLGGRLSPLGTELPDLGGRLSSPGTQAPDPSGPGSPPGTELPNPNRRLAPPGTEVPDLDGRLSPPGTQAPDPSGPGSPPGTELPNPNRRLSPPGTQAPDPSGPGSPPGTEVPDPDRRPSPPVAEVPDPDGRPSPPAPDMPEPDQPTSSPGADVPAGGGSAA